MPISSVAPIDVRELRGTPLPALNERTATTKSTTIHCFVEEGGQALPGYRDEPRMVADPDAGRDLGLAGLDVSSAAGFAASFEAVRKEALEYLLPAEADLAGAIGDTSRFAYNSITGARIQRFIDEAQAKVEASPATGTEKTAIRRAFNLASENMWNRLVRFDAADTGTYNSYSRAEEGHLQTFAPVFEAMRDSCEPGSALALKCQEEIDHIYTFFCAPKGTVDERDIEVSKEMPMIDRATRARVTQGTGGGFTVYQVPETSRSANKGRFVFQLGSAWVFNDNQAPVPAADKAALQQLPVEKIAFRPMKPGEQLRPGMQWDWNRSRDIDLKAHKTEWFGFCNDQANEEAKDADFAGLGSEVVFRADSEKEVVYPRLLALGAQTALLNFGSVYVSATGEVENKSSTKFAGARFDDRPSVIQIGRDTYPIEIDSMTRVDSGRTAGIQDAFMRNVPDADSAIEVPIWDPERGANVPTPVFTKFHRNPDFLEAVSGDLNFIKGDAHIVRGRLKEDVPSASGGVVKTGTPVEFNPATGSLTAVRGATGSAGIVIRATGGGERVYVGREMQNGDATLAKREMRREAMRTGNAMCTDRDNGMQVWNGKVEEMEERRVYLSDDGAFEVCENYVKSKYGTDVGIVIYMRDDSGRVVDTCEYKSATDFLWRTQDYVAPYIVKDGAKWWNQTLVERGMVQFGEGEAAKTSQTACVAMIERLSALVHRAATAKPMTPAAAAGGAGGDGAARAAEAGPVPATGYTIEHQGVRVAYEDESTFREDIARLQEEADIARAESEPPTTLGQRMRRATGCCSC